MSQNRYAYGHNNPINQKDPSGHYIIGIRDNPIGKNIGQAYFKGKTRDTKEKLNNNNFFIKKKLEKATGAEEYNKSFKNKVDTWQGQSGEIGRRYYQSLIANGVSPEKAYLVAENIKKMCDTLSSQQLTAVQEKINCMSIQTTAIPDFLYGKKEHLIVEEIIIQLLKRISFIPILQC